MLERNSTSNNVTKPLESSFVEAIMKYLGVHFKIDDYLKFSDQLSWVVSTPLVFLLVLLPLCLALRLCLYEHHKTRGIVKFSIEYAVVIFEACIIIPLMFSGANIEYCTRLGISTIVSLFILLSFNSVVFCLALRKIYGIISLFGASLCFPATVSLTDPAKYWFVLLVVYLLSLILQFITKTAFIFCDKKRKQMYDQVEQPVFD